MERQGTGPALILLLLGACATPPASPRGGADAVTVSWELDTPTLEPREGDLAAVVFTLRNTGRNPVVLRDLTFLADPAGHESASAAASWQFSRAGILTLHPERNEWTFVRSSREQTAPAFNSGLLVPKETVTVRTRLRLLRFPKNLQLFYYELTPEDLRQKVYFELRQERERRYRLLVGRELEAELTPKAREDVGGHREVLFPHALQLKARIQTFQVHAALQPRPFTFDQALRKAGGTAPSAYTFSTSLDGWIFGRDEDFSLVTPQGVSPLPRIRQLERFFFHVDSVGIGKHEVELARESIAVAFRELKYGVVPTQDKRPRYFLFVSGSDLPRFFTEVRTLKLVLDVEVTPEGGGRIVVKPD